MGFDLTGLDPKMNAEHPQEYNDILKLYGKDGWLDWSMDIPEATKDRYFELQDQFREDNPGDYFRNNVWWWRPLWSFVCNTCDDFLTDNDMNKGGSNSGEKISKTKAIKIGKRLSQKIADGTADMVYRKYELASARAKVHNDLIEKEMDKISKECKEKHGKDLVPADFPEPYKTRWDKAYSEKSWDDSYPFNRDNVENFAKFCLESGGFEIC